MQREILFRIWDKKNKKMINDVHICPEYGWLVMSDNDALEELGRYNPEDLVWMQYTGLKDKNGMKIFEGDIVENKWFDINGKNIGSIWEVKFGEYDNSDIEYGSGGNIGFYVYDVENENEEGLNNLPSEKNEGIKIIGNIFDNVRIGFEKL